MCALWMLLVHPQGSPEQLLPFQGLPIRFSQEQRSKSAAGTAVGVLLASGVFCKKEYKRFLDRSSALSFRVPGRCSPTTLNSRDTS